MGLFNSDGKRRRKELEKEASQYGAAFVGLLDQEGLPIASTGLVLVALLKDGIQIKSETHTFFISQGQVKNVSYTASLEAHKSQKRSLAKGVAGGVLFGTPGAIVGSAPKEKTDYVTSRSAVVITYVSEGGEEKEISFSILTLSFDKTLRNMQKFAAEAQRAFVTSRLSGEGTIRL